jgi:hypothetical protein
MEKRLKGRTEERERNRGEVLKKVRDKMGDTAIYIEKQKRREQRERAAQRKYMFKEGEYDDKKCHLICFLN